MLAAMDEGADLSSLRAAVSAGETLPAPVYGAWMAKTGKPMLDGIGATEMLHIFITNRFGDSKAACTGKPVAGYEAKVVDDDMREVPRGTVGFLAVRGLPGAGTSRIGGNVCTCATGGTSPATRSCRTTRATSTSQLDPTT